MSFEPEIEELSVAHQEENDSILFRKQINYLVNNSEFYKNKLSYITGEFDIANLANINKLPFTEKDELRKSQEEALPFGTHLAANPEDLVRIYSTSGTSGVPSIIALTSSDLKSWATNTARSFSAAGIKPGQRIISMFNAGPFVAGATYDGLLALKATVIPLGIGDTERLINQVIRLNATAIACTPSYVLYIIEWCKERKIEPKNLGIENIVTAGEPGGGDPLFREKVEKTFNCKVREVMGNGDIATSIWGECEFGNGMHFSGRNNVYVELIDPETKESVSWKEGAEGELVYTSLNREAMPLLRARSRDHVHVISAGNCKCGRTSPAIRCIGRTDDMLIIRGVNLFPTAIRRILNKFKDFIDPDYYQVRPESKSISQSPPLPITIELKENIQEIPDDLSEKIAAQIRKKLIVTVNVTLVKSGELPRSNYKRKLLDFSFGE